MIEDVPAITSVVKRLVVGEIQMGGKDVIRFGVVRERTDVWLAAVFGMVRNFNMFD